VIKSNLAFYDNKSRNKLDPKESYNYINSIILIDNNTINQCNLKDAINSPINQSRLDESQDDQNLNEWKKTSVTDKIKRSFIKLSKNADSILGDGTKENVGIHNNYSSGYKARSKSRQPD